MMDDRTNTQDLSIESLLGEVAGEFSERLSRGEVPNIEDYARRYPQVAELIRQVFPALGLLRVAPDPTSPPDAPTLEPTGARSLGDYQIIREIGRGGMGVVYEAEQLSLGRRVALKVLPFAAVLDQRQLQRFKNEAQAAAALHHTNIVPIYQVGCERAVHFYAMQYVEGQTLAEVIAELRRVAEPDGSNGDASCVSQLAGDLTSGRLLPAAGKATGDDCMAEPSRSTSKLPPALAETHRQPQAGISTEGSVRSPQFFRSVAHLGIQAAEALEHAHGIGVVHRDIKPSNLLVDAAGHLWITDFGLAMTRTDTNLTMTGDLVGTLRYMSPEQVEAKHSVMDHRTDIYSLGVTLYELLTLQAAFAGDERQELMRRIIEEDPRPLRQLNRAIPYDLETIVFKAMAKEPKARYATAEELAEDLRRFIEDKPVKARRPSLLERATKWSRRHRPVVWSAAVVSVIAVVALSVTTALISWNYWLTRDAVDSLLDRVAQSIEEAAVGGTRRDKNRVERLVEYAKELDQKLPNAIRSSPRHRARLATMHYHRARCVMRWREYEVTELIVPSCRC